MNLVFRSLLCATIGWAVSLSVIIFGAVKSHFEAHPPAPGELAGNVAVFAVAMAVFILPTWILILLPLFLFTKKESFIWNYFFCPFLGIFIACSIIYIFGRINSPQADPAHTDFSSYCWRLYRYRCCILPSSRASKSRTRRCS